MPATPSDNSLLWLPHLFDGLGRAVKTILLFTLVAITGANSLAQTESVLVSFTGNNGAAPGDSPFGNLIQASDGDFYGTTQYGGPNLCGIDTACGTVFKVSSSGTVTLLYSFSGPDGQGPNAGLVQGTDGNFYGTTYLGGAYGSGTVFRITPSGAFMLLHSFSNTPTDGASPYAGLVQGTDGSFYGTTLNGGATGYSADGTVFKITSNGTFTLLHALNGTSDGSTPTGSLVQGTDGNFYGTAQDSGGYGMGTVFRVTPSGTFTVLYSFLGPDGTRPVAALIQGSNGDLYGTTGEGGDNNDGTVFSLSLSGGFTLLHSFSKTDGQEPVASLVQGSDGNFYGTTYKGGANSTGTVFSISASGAFTLLHSFGGATSGDGYFPEPGVVQGSDGNFYGTTYRGGIQGPGTVYRLNPATPLSAPVVLNVPASIAGGTNFVLSYAVSNATSDTMQQCFASNNAGVTDWTGIYAGSPTTATVHLTAPFTQGTYTYALTCGGIESGFATLVVTAPPPPVITLTGTPNPVFLLNPVTFTATVSSQSYTPTGSVTFLDGTTPLGTVGLSGGVASLTTSTLAIGLHNITAVYSDSNFPSDTSNVVPELVEDFSLTITNPDVVIPHGGTGVFHLVVTTVGGTQLASTVNFGIAGSPDHSPITFSPASVAVGSGTTNVTLTIQTPDYPVGPWSSIMRPPVVLALTVFGALLLPFGRRTRRARRLLLTLALASFAMLSGCGGIWKTQNYPITVTASAGPLTHSVSAKLTSKLE